MITSEVLEFKFVLLKKLYVERNNEKFVDSAGNPQHDTDWTDEFNGDKVATDMEFANDSTCMIIEYKDGHKKFFSRTNIAGGTCPCCRNLERDEAISISYYRIEL